MPEGADQEPPSDKQEAGPQPRKAGLLQSLKQAHELDHGILDALGINHPHIPILSVIEMLEHLRDKHADEPSKGSRKNPRTSGRGLPKGR